MGRVGLKEKQMPNLQNIPLGGRRIIAVAITTV